MRTLLTITFLIFASKADAAIYRLDVSASVNSISEYLGEISTPNLGNHNFHGGKISLGMNVTASFVFDTNGEQSSTFAADPTIDIWQAVVDSSVTFGSLVYNHSGWPFSFPMRAGIQVWNDRQVTSHPDIVTFSGGVFYTHPLDLGPGEEIAGLSAHFYSLVNTVFQNTQIPTQLDLEDFSYKNLSFIQFTRAESPEVKRTMHVQSTIESVKFTKISEPEICILLLLGILFIIRRRFRPI